MFERKLVRFFDWTLLCQSLILCIIGIITLYSALTAGSPSSHKVLYIKQLVWFGMGICAMIAVFLFNYRRLDRWAPVIYIGCILLLLLVMFIGKYAGGSRRWLVMGPLSIQPSEIAKIGLIVMLARYYSKGVDQRGFTLFKLIKPALITTVPFVLIVRQPDLGTAMLFVFIAASMTIFIKIEKRSFFSILITCAITSPIIWFFLQDYQKQRILSFLNPERDPLGFGYHIIQSKIAVGSGMLSGRGFLEGTQNALAFLPAQYTDFIFSVLAEEWGFAGSMVILLLFLSLIFLGLNIVYRCRDTFGTMLCLGVIMMIFWQVTINIGMAIGLMPVVGVPLPFISYGGSSIITTMAGIGILMNVSMRRFMFE